MRDPEDFLVVVFIAVAVLMILGIALGLALAVLAARYAAGSGKRPEEQRCRRSSIVDPVGGVNVYWQTVDWLEAEGLATTFGWDGSTKFVRLTRAGIELARREGLLA